MDEFYSEKGVFLHSALLNTKCMLDCLQSLFEMCPGIKITSVASDEMSKGYKVCFEDFEVRNILEKEFITVGGRSIYVYPLTTCLLIPNVLQSSNVNFEYELASAIQEIYGKVLHMEVQKTTDQRQDISIKSVIVQINVPEMKDLSIFKRNGYPEMFIRVPSIFKTFSVAFWCTHCKNSGHTRQECDGKPPKPDPSNTHEIAMKRDAEIPIQPYTYDPISFRIERNESENTVSCDAGTNVPERNLGDRKEENGQSFKKEQNYPHRNIPTLRQFAEVTSPDMRNAVSDVTRLLPVTIKQEVQNEENSLNSLPVATSTTTDDDDVKITKYQTSYDYVRDQFRDTGNGCTESNAIKEESTEPADAEESSNQKFPATCGASGIQRGPSTSSPEKHVGDISVLSDGLKKIIKDSCTVLNLENIKAFFIHVQKKSPIRIAANYTADVDGLKEQLKQILDLFYKAPKAGTKEDTYFINWLKTLIERFNVDTKKKRNKKVHGESPRKKYA